GCIASSGKRPSALATIGVATEWLTATGNRPVGQSYYASGSYHRSSLSKNHMTQQSPISAVQIFKETVATGETKTHVAPIDPGDRLMVALTYKHTTEDIKLILIDPTGKRIDPDSAAVDPDIAFDGGANPDGSLGIIGYSLNAFSSGSWSFEVSGADLPASTTIDYALSVMIDGSPITLDFAL